MLLHYLVECRSRLLAVYNIEFILGSVCVASENNCDHRLTSDYSLLRAEWSVLQQQVCRTKISDVDELK